MTTRRRLARRKARQDDLKVHRDELKAVVIRQRNE
jgi:hypothetical protein